MDVDLNSILRMVAAVVAGGAIGFNRDIQGKPTEYGPTRWSRSARPSW